MKLRLTADAQEGQEKRETKLELRHNRKDRELKLRHTRKEVERIEEEEMRERCEAQQK